MNRCSFAACLALSASAAACSAVPEDESAPGSDELDARGAKQKPPRDGPPVDQPPPPPVDSGGSAAFVDACALPEMARATFTPTGSFDATDEGVTAALPLPFPITLYGVAYTQYWITTNGQLGFGGTPGGSAFGQVTCPLPDARFAAPILLAYSADLVTRLEEPAGICYATVGTAPDRKLVVTWKNSFFYDAWLTSNLTFSAILTEGSSVLDVAIDRVDAPYLPACETGFCAVLGVQAGGSAATHSCFQERAPEGTVIHYST